MSAQRKAAPKGAARKASSRGSRSAKGPKKPLPRRILKWGLLAGLVGFLLGAAAFAYGYVATDIPNPNDDFQTETTIAYYKNGKGELGRFATQNRTSISLSEVPKHVQDAVIAAEDRTFRTNQGIDPKGIIRAAFSNAQGNATQGASTITQQYVKVFYLTQDRSLTRKVKEAFVSLKLQRTQSKNEILQGYLNTIYFGRGAYGIQAAAKAYFDKDAADLSVREGAALASILNSPGNLDPADGKESRARLESRYNYVLEGMAAEQMLPANDVAEAKERLPRFPDVPENSDLGGQRGYLMQLVKKELLQKGFSESEIEGGGLRVTSTFNRKVMRATMRAVRTNRPKGLKELHVGTATIDPRSGALRAIYAGQDYLKSNGGTNWATAGGAPGSSFKPFALAAGMKDGYSLKSTFEGNSPLKIGNTEFENQGAGTGTDYGSDVSLLKATEDSINTAYVDLTTAIKGGPQTVLDQAVSMGIPKNSTDLRPETGVALGAAIVSPIDMANSYGTIADGGRAKDWFSIAKVTSANGETLYKHSGRSERVIPEDINRDVSYALQQVAKVGSGTNANTIGRPIAGKTGTATNDKGQVRSSWFVGFTPQLSTAVMYVRGNGQEPLDGYLEPFFGGTYPAMTWATLTEGALDGVPVEQFPPPANVEATNDDPEHEPYTPPPPPPSPTKTKEPSPTPEPTPSPTPTPTPSPTPESTPSPTDPCGGIICDPSGSPGNGGGGGGGSSPSAQARDPDDGP